jgi:tRNA (guanine-N7-)-methyltransferase
MSIGQKPHGALRSYGRVKARPIKARQAGLLDTLLPTITVPDGPVDLERLKPDAVEVWLEIGFGGGEHLAEQAARRPDVLFLAAEPFLNGVASAVRHIDERKLSNVRLRHGDARELLADLPDASLSRIFILFPDPWPKTRHHKRRLIQPEVVADLARVLKPDAALRFATDWKDYADWTIERMARGKTLSPAAGGGAPAFRWTAERAADWREPPADHVTTRYEQKRLGDCAPVFLDFTRT